mmetsp:Transcript_80884/g.211019  ORF Transcript_80884/g.211019 Transcript_80884/m.211019 type:complete len:253 (-) Transcript_80884:179-937(-)
MSTAADIEAPRVAIAGVPSSVTSATRRDKPCSCSTGAGASDCVLVADVVSEVTLVLDRLVRVWLVVLAVWLLVLVADVVVAVAEVLSEVMLTLLVVIVTLTLVQLVVLAVWVLVDVTVVDVDVLVADAESEVALAVLVLLVVVRLVVLAVRLLVVVDDLVRVVAEHLQGQRSIEPSRLQSAKWQKKRSAQAVVVEAVAVEDSVSSETAGDVEVEVDEHSHGQTSTDTLHLARTHQDGSVQVTLSLATANSWT